ECWGEVRLGRAGRQLAESARELAPQPLRERVRGAVSLLPAPRIPWRGRLRLVTFVALAALGLAALALQVTRPEQPELIQTLIGHFEERGPSGRATPPKLPERLGDLHLVGAETVDVRGVRIDAHRYRDLAGHEVVVYGAPRAFPMAVGAQREGAVWEANAGGTVLFCADRPAPYLIAGDDRAEVHLAARLLGLT
ncbi:MAG: hypothetical protein ACRDH5_04340, partial [bacterium]